MAGKWNVWVTVGPSFFCSQEVLGEKWGGNIGVEEKPSTGIYIQGSTGKNENQTQKCSPLVLPLWSNILCALTQVILFLCHSISHLKMKVPYKSGENSFFKLLEIQRVITLLLYYRDTLPLRDCTVNFSMHFCLSTYIDTNSQAPGKLFCWSL